MENKGITSVPLGKPVVKPVTGATRLMPGLFRQLARDFSVLVAREPVAALGGVIDKSFATIGAQTGFCWRADRVLFELVPGYEGSLGSYHVWQADGLPDWNSFIYGAPRPQLKWLRVRLAADEPVILKRLSELPAEARLEKAWFERRGIRSIMVIPVVVEGVLAGVFAIAGCQKLHLWRESERVFARNLAAILRSAVLRSGAAHALTLSEQRYHNLAESAGDAIISWDETGNIVSWNSAAERIFGYPASEANGRSVSFMLDPEFKRRSDEAHLKVVKSGHLVHAGQPVIAVAVCRDGRRITFESTITRTQEHGRVLFTGVARDVTENQRMLKALVESEDRYRNMVDTASDAIFTWDLDGNVLSVNRAAEKMFGWASTEIMGRPQVLLIPERLRAAHLTGLSRARSGAPLALSGKPIVATALRKDGTEFASETSINVTVVGGRKIVTAIVRDVTERQRLEELTLYQASLVDNVTEAVVSTDIEGVVRTWNPAAERLFGRPAADVIGKNAFEIFKGVYVSRTGKHTEAVNQLQQVGYWSTEAVVTRPDGRQLPLLSSATLVRDSAGKPSYTIHVFRDVTALKLAQDSLRVSEEKYRLITDNINEAVYLFDMDLKLKYVSPSGIRARGYSLEELNAMPFEQQMTPSSFAMLTLVIQEELVPEKLADPAIMISRTIELELYRRDGSTFLTENTYTLLRGPDGIPIGVLGVGRDISERRKAEQRVLEFTSAVKESEERYRAVVETSTDAIITFDQDRRIVFWNQAAERLTGYYAKEAMGQFRDIIIPMADIEINNQAFRRALAAGRLSRPGVLRQGRIRRKDGSEIDAELTITLWKAGGRIYFTEILRDITERKQAEAELLESQALNKAVADSTSDMIWSVDPERFGLLTFNKGLRDYFTDQRGMQIKVGMTPEVLFTDQDYIDRWRMIYNQALAEGPLTTEYLAANGKTLLQLTISPLRSHNRVFGISVFGKDITESRKAEQNLRDSEERYRTVVQSLQDALITVNLCEDHPPRIVSWNPAAERLFGYTFEEVYGHEFIPMLVPQRHTVNQHHAFSRDVVKAGQLIRTQNKILEARAKRKDGTELAVEMTQSLWKTGDQVFVTLALRDVTQRKAAEEVLRVSEERYRAAMDSMQDAMITIEQIERKGGRIVAWNKAAERLFGYTSQEAENLSAYQILPPRRYTQEQHHQFSDEIVRRGELSISRGRIIELIARRKDGTEFPAELAQSLWKQGGRVFVTVTVRDITLRQKLAEERAQAEKLESVGLLAGGIAHDFNNILTSIMGNISLARLDAPADTELAEMLKEAENASQRAAGLTQQFLTFARGGAPVKKSTTLQDLLRDSVRFALRGSSVASRFSLPDDLWPADIDPGQVGRVINNLVINAREAMARGGNLRVEAVNLKLVEGEIYGLAAGSYIRVTVADDGPGIPSEHLKRLFEPYFSTKERGSGLGLSTAYSIIRNHGGTITVDSREGIGSTFDVYLQAATTAPDRGSAEGGVVEWKGSGRVLVMDDEDPVRETAGRMLERMGFEVDGAADGQEAVRRYRVARETGRPYRLVIMDLTVPGGMGGREAMQALRDYDPAACVIVSSGYSADAAMTEYASLGFRGVVPKPYSSEVLAEVVRKALVRPSPSP